MPMSRVLILLGATLLLAGLVMRFAPWVFSWFGKLPGDIRIERENGVFFIPVTSMLIVSVALSILLSFLFRK